MIIRDTTHNDIEQLEQIYSEAFKSNNRFFPDNMVEDNEEGEPDLSPSLALQIPEKTVLSLELDGTLIGGIILTLFNTNANKLDRLYIAPKYQGKGFGYEAWTYIEKIYPNPFGWELVTPTCLINNACFYINKCGFVISKVTDVCEDGVGMFVFTKYTHGKEI